MFTKILDFCKHFFWWEYRKKYSRIKKQARTIRSTIYPCFGQDLGESKGAGLTDLRVQS